MIFNCEKVTYFYMFCRVFVEYYQRVVNPLKKKKYRFLVR